MYGKVCARIWREQQGSHWVKLRAPARSAIFSRGSIGILGMPAEMPFETIVLSLAADMNHLGAGVGLLIVIGHRHE